MTDTVRAIHDTIFRAVHDTIVIRTENTLDVLNKVDQFYRSGWTNLAIVGTVILAGGAFVLPYFLDLLKKKQYKIDKEKDRQFFTREALAFKTELEEKINERINLELTSIQKMIKSELNDVRSNHFLVTAEVFTDKKEYGVAMANFWLSLDYALDVKDKHTIKICLSGIENCARNLTPVERSDAWASYQNFGQIVLKKLEAYDTDRRLISASSSIRELFNVGSN